MRQFLTVFLVLLCPVWNVLGQQSAKADKAEHEWEPFQAQKEKPALSGEPLTNDSIVKLLQTGFSQETILAMIEHRPGKYSLSTDDLVALKKTGVPERIITAMLNKTASEPISPKPAPRKGEARQAQPDPSTCKGGFTPPTNEAASISARCFTRARARAVLAWEAS